MTTATTTHEPAVSRTAEADRPEGPTQLGVQSWKALGRRTLQRAKRDRTSMMAGSIAYHGFLALFPVVIALLGLAALLHLGGTQVATLVRGIGKALPNGAAKVLNDAVYSAQHRTGGAIGVVVVAVVISIWSASGAMSTVETGLDIAYGVPEERKFLPARLRALALLGLVVLLGGAASVLVVFAKPLGHAIESHVPLSGMAFNVVWTVVRWAASLFLVVTLFSLLFRYGPNRQPPRWRWLSVGGVVGTVIWLISSLGLSFYDAATGSYSKTYGALAGVVVLLFWFYLTSLAILVGAQVNAEIEREAVELGGETGAAPPGEGPTRPAGDRGAVLYHPPHQNAGGRAPVAGETAGP